MVFATKSETAVLIEDVALSISSCSLPRPAVDMEYAEMDQYFTHIINYQPAVDIEYAEKHQSFTHINYNELSTSWDKIQNYNLAISTSIQHFKSKAI